MLSERTAMAKVRGRIRREMAHAEDEAEVGGEINLVPYLDIVVNTVIFLLATTASALALANINVNSPRYEEPTAGITADQNPEDKPKLNLTVAVSYTGFIVAGAGGVMTGKSEGPTIPCKTALKKGRCPVFQTTRTDAEGQQTQVWVDQYNYKALVGLMKKIKASYTEERQAILTADRLVPYKVVVQTMDTLRGKASSKCTGKDGCLFDQVILSAGVQ